MTADQTLIDDSFEPYRDYLLLVARGMIGVSYRGKVDAEELVNESLFDAFQQRERFQGTTEAERIAWLRRILTDNVTDALRFLQMTLYTGTEKTMAKKSFLRAALVVALAGPLTLIAQESQKSKPRQAIGESQLPIDWDITTGKNILWSVPLGSETNGSPVVAGGKVYIGTNNGHGYLKRYPPEVDLGCLLCFDAKTGAFLWQYSAEKLPTGRLHDWPEMGICSTPLVEGDRLWFVSNRGEIVCLDTAGFDEQENDRFDQREFIESPDECDIVWILDMMNELGVEQHNMANCSVTAADGILFVTTSNGVDKSHVDVPAPEAPSFLAVDQKTGEVLWSDSSPGKNILHGQWSSPAVGWFDGNPQVLFAGGDGWLYSFAPAGDSRGSSQQLWSFDCNPKDSEWRNDGRGSRSNVIATPVIHDGYVYVSTGVDPEKPPGQGYLWCIDAQRFTDGSDVSADLAVDANRQLLPRRRTQAVVPADGERAIPNPKSAAVWGYSGRDQNGDGIVSYSERLHRTLSNVAIKDDLLILPDLGGVVHCLNAKTGEVHWTCDLLDQVWATPLIANDHVFVPTDGGFVAIFYMSADPSRAMTKEQGQYKPLRTIDMDAPIHATPTADRNVLYIATSKRLYAIAPPAHP